MSTYHNKLQVLLATHITDYVLFTMTTWYGYIVETHYYYTEISRQLEYTQLAGADGLNTLRDKFFET